ncbi:MAG: hypothetical protein ACREDW_00355, partial [Aestuariivirgaceae bacterium]
MFKLQTLRNLPTCNDRFVNFNIRRDDPEAPAAQVFMSVAHIPVQCCNRSPSRGEQVGAIAWLCRVFVDRAAARDALARREFGIVFDGPN